MVGATVWQINFYRLLALRLLVFLYLLFRYRGCSGTGYGFVVFSARE